MSTRRGLRRLVGGNDRLLAGLPRHLAMCTYLVLVACHQQVTAFVKQRGRFVLLKAYRVLLYTPKRAAVDCQRIASFRIAWLAVGFTLGQPTI